MSKFPDSVAETLYEQTPDVEAGSVDELGWYGLYRAAPEDAPTVGDIISEDYLGFVYHETFTDQAELDKRWAEIEQASADYFANVE